MKTILSIVLRAIIAIILLQTLYFKFTAHPDSVHIFTLLGVEPWGRISLGILELITSIALFVSVTRVYAVLLSIGLMLGAIGSHILVLGINVRGDGGNLFVLALIVLFAAISYLILQRVEVRTLVKTYL